MPDPKKLKLVDKIVINSIPNGDETEYQRTKGNNQETYDVLKWMVGKEFIIEIIDEYHPWVIVRGYPSANGTYHSIAILDKESWSCV